MRLLLNENIPGAAVRALRRVGHEVVWIREEAPGAKDSVVLARAREEGRILVTFDRGFAQLAFRSGLAAPAGILLLRMEPQSPAFVARRLHDVLAGSKEWEGRIAVVEYDRVRVRSLPPVS